MQVNKKFSFKSFQEWMFSIVKFLVQAFCFYRPQLNYTSTSSCVPLFFHFNCMDVYPMGGKFDLHRSVFLLEKVTLGKLISW